MNKATEWIYEDIEPLVFGHLLMFVIENSPKLFERCKKLDNCINELPDPRALVKYSIRRYWRFPNEDGRITLFQLKEPQDPYETVTFWKFNGTFTYNEKKKAYVPLGNDVEGTRVMRRIYQKLEEKYVRGCWNKAIQHLGEVGEKYPTLDYDFK
ncbi:hypothetical protein [Fodinibius halophilus]|uniref:Uncharacterized protein n=1 Tax=Fodinibius halophilus TaxID=1736908 RepID=A0A6M1SVF9_9BACT|nr:hypothetical protein [Fodinibius halophilus]NGP87566.1 hypothetical protein [Fodinibius halophilus]